MVPSDSSKNFEPSLRILSACTFPAMKVTIASTTTDVFSAFFMSHLGCSIGETLRDVSAIGL
jgi:hypothetical protein